MISSAVMKPKMAVPSARAQPISSALLILPEASGWRAMASLALPVANPMPMPAPMPVKTAMAAAMIAIDMIGSSSECLDVVYGSSLMPSPVNRVVRNTKTTVWMRPSNRSK